MRTRCPTCNTVFRVTSDQLRAKAGKVKCGFCQCIFNAFQELIDDPPKTPPAVVAAADVMDARGPGPEPKAVTALASEPATLPEPVAGEVQPEIGAEAEADSAADPAKGLMEETAASEDDDGHAETAGAGVAAEETASDVCVEPDLEAADRDLDSAAEIAAISGSTATEAEQEAEGVGAETVEEATRAACEAGPVAAGELAEAPAYNRWTAGALDGAAVHPRATWPFVVALLLLLAALAFQLAYYYRSDLVRHVPVAGELFAALGIAVPLPTRSELVSIEASDLQSDNVRGLFVLQATLRNQAAYAQAWPALELTLTDASDAVVARRVLSAADYLAPGKDLTSFPADAEVPVRLWIDAKGLGAAGYKLYIFYPRALP